MVESGPLELFFLELERPETRESVLAMSAASFFDQVTTTCADAALPRPPHGARPWRLPDWWVTVRDPREIWHDEHTFLFCELNLPPRLSCLPAARRHGRYLAVVDYRTHGLPSELVSYWYEDVDNFWPRHLPSCASDCRPLHIICLYPGYIYPVCVVWRASTSLRASPLRGRTW